MNGTIWPLQSCQLKRLKWHRKQVHLNIDRIMSDGSDCDVVDDKPPLKKSLKSAERNDNKMKMTGTGFLLKRMRQRILVENVIYLCLGQRTNSKSYLTCQWFARRILTIQTSGPTQACIFSCIYSDHLILGSSKMHWKVRSIIVFCWHLSGTIDIHKMAM